ncbi:hypothetical protein [Aliiglaciecola lipolytica]|uniref:PEP-CTERM protein-sorting domain-containing protein n=1 Tax=Aliiglaciecola lipolytica E3 TaxID=1127673 RepID=K6WXK1_9ALTE|nr:hypothetical protein [Aliiglaciecola lipolytica]GAC13199.1 hypothetical protein GLIP_0553 [Aliiglaciecola lipolytica E3]
MDKPIKMALLVLAISSMNAPAAIISNGDFSSCNYNGWQKDTDGFGDVSLGNDFAIKNDAGNCAAVINVDHFDVPGDSGSFAIDEAFFANTLYQELDLSADLGSTLWLDIQFSVDSEVTSANANFVADYFLIGLNDGLGNYYDHTGALGFLIGPSEINGAASQSVSFELDSSFANQNGWFLDFQLNVGIDDFALADAYGSSFIIDNISLKDVNPNVDVNEPSGLWLCSLALLGLRRRRTKPSNN